MLGSPMVARDYLSVTEREPSYNSEMRHWCCRARSARFSHRLKVDLRFFRVSKVVFREARNLVYSHNTLAFRSIAELEIVVQRLRKGQVEAITSISLDVRLPVDVDIDLQANLGNLRGLRRVYLSIALNPSSSNEIHRTASSVIQLQQWLQSSSRSVGSNSWGVRVTIDDHEILQSLAKRFWNGVDGTAIVRNMLSRPEKLYWARKIERHLVGLA